MFLFVWFSCVYAKISELDVFDDPRRLFAIETFGFLPGGVHQMELRRLKAPLSEHVNCGPGKFILQVTGKDGEWKPSSGSDTPHAGFIFKLSTPDSTTQMEESYSEGLCLIDQKHPEDVFVPLAETDR